jgi:hypothetical protein
MSESLEVKIARLEEQVKTLWENMKEKVSESDFEPIKLLVYGMTGMVLVAVCGALIKLVVMQ